MSIYRFLLALVIVSASLMPLPSYAQVSDDQTQNVGEPTARGPEVTLDFYREIKEHMPNQWAKKIRYHHEARVPNCECLYSEREVKEIHGYWDCIGGTECYVFEKVIYEFYYQGRGGKKCGFDFEIETEIVSSGYDCEGQPGYDYRWILGF